MSTLRTSRWTSWYIVNERKPRIRGQARSYGRATAFVGASLLANRMVGGHGEPGFRSGTSYGQQGKHAAYQAHRRRRLERLRVDPELGGETILELSL